MRLFIDFLCPFAWRGLELAETLSLRPRLVHYSLVQGNHPDNPDRKQPTWLLARQPRGEGSAAQQHSLEAFLWAQAARRQGDEAERRFSLELFRARHQDGRDLGAPGTGREAARRAELDLDRFERDLADEDALRGDLARDLDDAAALGVFGTPTFVLDSGEAAYLRFRTLPSSRGDAERLWQLYQDVLRAEVGIETIKRPR